MPTVTVRPSATVLNQGSVTGAASAHAALADDSDSSYVTMTPANRQNGFTFPIPSLPAGGRWKTARGRQRARASSSTVKGSTDLAMEFPTSGPKTGAPIWQYGRVFFATGSFAELVVNDVAMPDANPTRVMFASNHYGLSGDNLLIAELYVDFVYAAQPTCTVTAPSGTVTDTTQPTLAATHTPGADGGAQSAAQYRVFNAAQYGAAGFNPATSTAFWSTNITGATSTATPSVQFVDDDYRFYARTAQNINGQPHWSDWAYTSFTVDSDPPPAPTIAATPQDASADVRLTVTIDDTEASVARVEVSSDGGSTWAPVRGVSRVNVIGATWIGYDREAPPDVPVQYRAQAIRPTVNGDIASDWSTIATAQWTTAVAWLKDPSRPSLNIQVDASVLPDPVFAAVRGVHKIVDSPYPKVRTGRRQAQTGVLELQTRTADEFAALQTVLRSEVVLLQPPASWTMPQMYLSVGDIQPQRWGNPLPNQWGRQWQIPYTEVDRPADDGAELVAVGGTWQDWVDEGGTWQDLLDEGGTWGDLV